MDLTFTQSEIKAEVDRWCFVLAKETSDGTFMLSKTAKAAADRVVEMQQHCKHSYVDGACVYCRKKEPNAEE